MTEPAPRKATPPAHGGLKAGAIVGMLTMALYFMAPKLTPAEQGMVTAAVLGVTTIVGKIIRDEAAKHPPESRWGRILMELGGGLL